MHLPFVTTDYHAAEWLTAFIGYFIKTLSLGMKQSQIQEPQNGYSAQELGKF